jgi:hypothetical protein
MTIDDGSFGYASQHEFGLERLPLVQMLHVRQEWRRDGGPNKSATATRIRGGVPFRNQKSDKHRACVGALFLEMGKDLGYTSPKSLPRSFLFPHSLKPVKQSLFVLGSG